MATGFFRVNASFLVGDKEGQDPILDQFKSAQGDTLQLSIVQGPSRGIAFKAGPHNLEDGNLAISAAEDGLQVDADATFKVSLRPGVEEEFFDDDSKWEFSGICDGEFGPNLLGTVHDGLEEEVYEFKNRMGSGTASRYLIDVATAESKNVL